MSNDYDIAIIGMSGEFPGSPNLKMFWQNLLIGKESLLPLTAAQLQEAGISKEQQTRSNYVAVAGALESIDLFAADFFGYSPREAEQIDPQQRKLLEHTWQALEDAGISTEQYQGNIGVFVGSSLNTYLLNNILSYPDIKNADDIQQILFGNGQDYLATRIAYLLNLRGIAINVQTACSTSLVAVHEACQYLLLNQIDVAIAGGVSISIPQHKGYLYSIDGMLSPDGHCRPLSNEPGGTVFSSGLGVIILKRYLDAITDGDDIYAVIKGSAVNNDGHQKVGYTAPSVDGQAEVIALAQAVAGISPEDFSFIETHGTATTLGDLIELSALQKAFSSTSRKQFCTLGSLKSNIGHLDVAAGIAGLIKTVLALHNKKIPGTLHCEVPTSKINWQNSPFCVNVGPRDWKSNGHRYAGVSSFGIGGTNAHVVLSDFESPQEDQYSSHVLLIFSAKSKIELQQQCHQFAKLCEENPSIDISRLARTLQEGRNVFNFRTAKVVNSVQETISWLQSKNLDITNCEQILENIEPKSFEQCSLIDLELLKDQWLRGYNIEWKMHYQNIIPRKLHCPTYPFKKESYWIKPYLAEQFEETERLPMSEWFYLPSWQKSILSNYNYIQKDSIVLVFLDKNITTIKWLNELALNCRVITVFADNEFNQLTDSSFSLNFTLENNFEKLLKHLISNDIRPTHLLHALTFTSNWENTSYEIFKAHQYNGLLSLIFFLQSWEKICQDALLYLTVLTNRLNQVANETNIEPHKAPILAAVKVIPKEYPHIQTQLIDLDFLDQPQFANYQLMQLQLELFKDSYDQEEIVYRGTQRWLRDYAKAIIPALITKTKVLKSNLVLLITGGLGQLGLDIAEYFSQNYECSIALLSRKKLPPTNDWDQLISTLDSGHSLRDSLERLQTIKKMGAKIFVFSADVGDKAQLKQAINEIENDLGSITAIIHAAGETVNGIISLKTTESLEESYRAKVAGSYNLYELFKDRNLVFFIFCSSMNAIIGGLGQLDNTAANAFIDYLADFIAAKNGNNVFAINWGAINLNRPIKVNVLHQFIDLSKEHKKNNMTNNEVHQVYEYLLQMKPGSRVVISTIAMNHVLKNWNRVASVEELSKDRSAYQQYQTRILAPEDEPQSEIAKWISNCWQHLLGLNTVGMNDNFFQLGGHSLASVQFITKIKEVFNIKTHVMTLYEYPTLRAFTQYLENKMKGSDISLSRL